MLGKCFSEPFYRQFPGYLRAHVTTLINTPGLRSTVIDPEMIRTALNCESP